MQATVTNIQCLTKKVCEFEFSYTQSNPQLSFLPGQFIALKVNETTTRPYSICSDYKEKTKLKIAVSLAHEGEGADYLKSLKVGDTVEFNGPFGSKLLPTNLPAELVFVAAGTGITPLLAMFHQLADMPYTGKATLYWGLHDESDLFHKDLLESFKAKMPNFNYVLQYSATSGRVTDLLPQFTNTAAQYFLCGQPEMVKEMQAGLVKNGVPVEKIWF